MTNFRSEAKKILDKHFPHGTITANAKKDYHKAELANIVMNSYKQEALTALEELHKQLIKDCLDECTPEHLRVTWFSGEYVWGVNDCIDQIKQNSSELLKESHNGK